MGHSARKFKDILPFHFDLCDSGQKPTLHVHAFSLSLSPIAGFIQVQHSFFYLNPQSVDAFLMPSHIHSSSLFTAFKSCSCTTSMDGCIVNLKKTR